MHKVIFYTRLASHVGRSRLQGVFDYLCDNHRNWDLRLPQTCEQFFAEIRNGLPQGMIIANHQEQQVFRWAESSDIPTLYIDIYGQGRPRERPTGIIVRNDDGGFGLLAARHLLHLGGFASYGYVPSPIPAPWCRRRQEGFMRGLQGTPKPVCGFSGDFDRDFGPWLLSLAKPTALYVAYDELARRVIDVCRARGLAVGREVAVLGTDNDEIVCTLTDPEISSIEPDAEGEGYQAAKHLDALLVGGRIPQPKTILCKAKRLVSRASTRPPPAGQSLVQAVLAYIRRDYAQPITPTSIAAKFNCSRRLLDIRFCEATQMTLAEKLGEIRLNAVKARLGRTSLPFALIASQCGFPNANSLRNLFKRRFGISLRDYRKQRARPVTRTSGNRPPAS